MKGISKTIFQKLKGYVILKEITDIGSAWSLLLPRKKFRLSIRANCPVKALLVLFAPRIAIQDFFEKWKKKNPYSSEKLAQETFFMIIISVPKIVQLLRRIWARPHPSVA